MVGWKDKERAEKADSTAEDGKTEAKTEQCRHKPGDAGSLPESGRGKKPAVSQSFQKKYTPKYNLILDLQHYR